jgi:glyoxylase-like metal-dependent hydrolase (beta-lactamase superfamily II)
MPMSKEAQTAPIKIGQFKVDRVEDFIMAGAPPRVLLPDLEESVFADHPWLKGPAICEPRTGSAMSSVHSWVLRDGSRTIVIDTGTGNNKNRDFPGFRDHFHMLSNPYLDRLAAVGVSPNDVTHVIITHLHMDHVGWNTVGSGEDWKPTFPNARYVFGSADMARNLNPEALSKNDISAQTARDSILPVIEEGLVDQSEPGMELFPGLTFEAAPGHTPDQLMIRLRSDDDEALFTADTFHTPIQVAKPEWSSMYCMDRGRARDTREKILKGAAENGTVLFPAHFCSPFCGRIVKSSSGYSLVDLAGKEW